MNSTRRSRLVDDHTFFVQPQITPLGGPIFFARSTERPTGGHILSNGGFGLVDTGAKKLLITCSHVWEGFLSMRSEFPELKLCVGLNPEGILTLGPIQPIDQDSELDLASFDMGPYLEPSEHSQFAPLRVTNPPRVKKREWLDFIGYSGRIKADTSIGIRFLRTLHAIAVYDFDDWTIVSNMQNVKPVGKQIYQQAAHRGGVSGSPCFSLRSGLIPQIVGFVTSEALGIIKITRVNCINADGTLRRRS